MLKGKTALVTGSTSGIGLGIAEKLAAQGANVILNGFGDTAAPQAAVSAAGQAHGVKVGFHGADMSKPAEIAEMMAYADQAFGGVDVLVNNAGIQHVSPIEDFPADKWDAILALNLSAAFHAIRTAFGPMKKAGWGRIINVASAHGLVASPFKSAYVAAKHGIVGLTKTVALEGARHGVTCNAICPGYVWTPLVENQIGDTANARGISREEVIENVLLAAQPSKKFASVDELGALAAFLCSEGGQSITGTALPVDGGWTAQ